MRGPGGRLGRQDLTKGISHGIISRGKSRDINGDLVRSLVRSLVGALVERSLEGRSPRHGWPGRSGRSPWSGRRRSGRPWYCGEGLTGERFRNFGTETIHILNIAGHRGGRWWGLIVIISNIAVDIVMSVTRWCNVWVRGRLVTASVSWCKVSFIVMFNHTRWCNHHHFALLTYR